MKNLAVSIFLVLTACFVVACGQADPAPIADERAHAEEGKAHAEGVVRLTDEQIADASIELESAGAARIRETLPLYGVITPNAVGVRQVTGRFPGVIRSLSKNFGDSVRSGETLAAIESNESLQRYDVTAPIGGVVITRDANIGEQSGERVLFTIADLSTVWVELALFPRDVAKVRVGQVVSVRGAEAADSADGQVIWVAPFGSTANQTLTARVQLENSHGRWAPGLYVMAEVTLAETDVPVAIRNAALQTLEGRTVVFVRNGGEFEPRPVQLGRGDNDYAEVTSGLAAGESYVVRNSFVLKAELGKGEAEHDD